MRAREIQFLAHCLTGDKPVLSSVIMIASRLDERFVPQQLLGIDFSRRRTDMLLTSNEYFSWNVACVPSFRRISALSCALPSFSIGLFPR